MPSFDTLQQQLGRAQAQPYVPLSARAATGVGATAVPQNGTDPISASSTANPPPNASNAPQGNTNQVFTGLMEALNTYQQQLVKNGKYQYADVYSIEFSPAIGQATLKRQGVTDYAKSPMQDPTKNASAINSATNSTNMSSKSLSVSAGMQIVQFIDEVVRSSSYITDQQLYVVDEVTQKIKPNPNPPGGQLSWYKINVQATQLQYDEKRRDHAYNMKFVITPYAINSMVSDWFPQGRYRGSHKSYNYWFTGQNTQILHFEQEYNSLYRLIISGSSIPSSRSSDFRDQYRKTFLPTSEQHSKTANGYTNEAGDNAADFLYSPTDQAKCLIQIVGDPAWMQQGEVATGVSASTFNFSPFNSDGTINYDSQEVVFDISWNRPSDYDLSTGLVNFNSSNPNLSGSYNTQPQERATYTAVKCKNIFSKGKFEQEIEGRLLIEVNTNNSANTGGLSARADNSAVVNTAIATARSALTGTAAAGSNNSDFYNNAEYEAPPDQTSTPGASDGNQSQTDSQPASPQPAGVSENPTSDGDIATANNNDAESATGNTPDDNSSSSQLIAQDDS